MEAQTSFLEWSSILALGAALAISMMMLGIVRRADDEQSGGPWALQKNMDWLFALAVALPFVILIYLFSLTHVSGLRVLSLWTFEGLAFSFLFSYTAVRKRLIGYSKRLPALFSGFAIVLFLASLAWGFGFVVAERPY